MKRTKPQAAQGHGADCATVPLLTQTAVTWCAAAGASTRTTTRGSGSATASSTGAVLSSATPAVRNQKFSPASRGWGGTGGGRGKRIRVAGKGIWQSGIWSEGLGSIYSTFCTFWHPIWTPLHRGETDMKWDMVCKVLGKRDMNISKIYVLTCWYKTCDMMQTCCKGWDVCFFSPAKQHLEDDYLHILHRCSWSKDVTHKRKIKLSLDLETDFCNIQTGNATRAKCFRLPWKEESQASVAPAEGWTMAVEYV